MSSRTISRTVLVCDGCGAELDNDLENVMTARVFAYGQGWRFPNKVNSKGTTVKRTSDVCPSCLPTWEPQVDSNSWTDARRAQYAESMRSYRKSEEPA